MTIQHIVSLLPLLGTRATASSLPRPPIHPVLWAIRTTNAARLMPTVLSGLVLIQIALLDPKATIHQEMDTRWLAK